MDTATQEQLLSRAENLSRRIYASLPWGYRVAQLLLVLAGDGVDAFGRTVLAEMIAAGVADLDDINGRPASAWVSVVALRGPSALPLGSGRDFAARVYRALIARFGADAADEAMSAVMLQAARGKLSIRAGSPRRTAESYVVTVALNAARDAVRSRGRAPIPVADEQIDTADPRAFSRLEEILPRAELARTLRRLEKVDPRAPDWLRARLDGLTGVELARLWGVSPSYVAKWERTRLPALRRELVQLRDGSPAASALLT